MVGLTLSSTRTPPALSSALSLRSASSASLSASVQAWPVSLPVRPYMTFEILAPMLLTQFLSHLPTVVVSAMACSFLYQRRTDNPIAMKWAIWGFGLAAAQVVLSPISQGIAFYVAQTLPRTDVAFRSNTIQSVYLLQTVMWSLFHATIYLCLYLSMRKLLSSPAA